MFYRTIPMAMLAIFAGCAGTKQAAVEPVAMPVPVAEAASAPQPAIAQTPERAPALAVADVTPAPKAAKPAAAQMLADPYHYQCMLAWAKNMQGALAPWAQTAQACDTHPSKP